jgi:hypothetical protein
MRTYRSAHEFSRVALIVLGAFILCLDVFAMRTIFTSSFYDRGQHWAQAALILFAPIIGASLALYLSREDVPLF